MRSRNEVLFYSITSMAAIFLKKTFPTIGDRTVTTEEFNNLCNGFSGCGFVETSAKKNWNIDELFRQLFQLADLPSEMAPNSHRRLLPSQVLPLDPYDFFRTKFFIFSGLFVAADGGTRLLLYAAAVVIVTDGPESEESVSSLPWIIHPATDE